MSLLSKQMLRIFVVFPLIFISMCWAYAHGFDPDADICKDPSLSGGVVADDGETYLFKGQYYWRTRPLTRDSGIVGYGNLISSKWPEVTSNVKLVFTVPKDKELMTIFVVKTKWFGYQKGVKVMDGNINTWPGFAGLSVTAAFTPLFAGSLVYILHSDNNYYILYDFADVNSPKKVRSGQTTIRETYLVFTEDSSKSMPGTSIRTLIDVRAGLTYKRKLFLLSKETYCVINLSAESFERECNPRNLKEILGCPLDLSKRPVPSVATPTKSSETTVAITNTKMETTSESEKQLNNSTVSEPIPSVGNISDSDTENSTEKREQIRTGIPVLGRELEYDEYSDDSQTSQPRAGVAEEDIHEKSSKNSKIWFIGFVVALIAITIFGILLVGIVSRVRNKRRGKGNVFKTK